MEGAKAVPFTDIDPLDAEWNLDQRIPVAEITMIGALGNTGKGVLSIDMIARRTTGRPLPGESAGREPAGAVWISTEDHPNVVTRPRLDAAGADVSLVRDLSMVDGVPFQLPEHESALRRAVDDMPSCAWVFLDPFAGVAPFPLTSVARVRSVLRPLQSLAYTTGVSVVMLHHVTKAGSLAGSQAVWDAVRSVLMLTRDKSNPTVRCLSLAKSNMGLGPEDVPVIRFAIDRGEVDEQPHVRYLSDAAKPESGQAAILRYLTETGGTHSGQDIAKAVRLAYATTRVLLARLAAKGEVESPQRGLFRAVTVTTAGQPRNTPRGVTGTEGK